jgi:acetyl-CoA C-acetyltransferase
MGDMKYIDTMIRDGLWDAFNGYHMGQTAENVAEQWQISRDMQDEFAVASRTRPKPRRRPASSRTRSFAVTIKGRKGDIVVDRRRVHPPRRHDGGMPSCARPSPRTAR